MARIRRLILSLIALCIFSIPSPGILGDTPHRPCVVLVVNSLTLKDIVSGRMPRLSSNLRKMGIALLNLKTNGGYNPEKILLGLSAGSPVQANCDGDLFLSRNEIYNQIPAKTLYSRLFGQNTAAEILNPFYASLKLQNLHAEFLNQIGYIGTELHRRGERTGFWGDSDPDPQTPSRAAALIIADVKGRIDFGEVGEAIQRDAPSDPSGKRIDEYKLWDSFHSRAAQTSLAVIDWGEIEVLDYWAPYLPPGRYYSLRWTYLTRLDRFLARLFIHCVNTRTDLIVLSAAVPKNPALQERLGLAILYNPDWHDQGLLTSATTRTIGMISPYDLHQFIVEKLGIPAPDSSIGASLRLAKGNLAGLINFDTDLNTLEQQRTPILIIIIYFFSLLIIIGGVTALFIKNRGRVVQWLCHLLLWTMTVPIAFLWVGILKPYNILLHLVFGIGIALLIFGVVVFVWKDLNHRLEAIALCTALSLLLDAILRGAFSQWSVLGYSVASGARYYGLGNEYTGIFVGTSILCAGFFLQHATRLKQASWIIGLGFLIIPIAVGFPRFGANFGDIVPMLPILGITLILMTKWRVRLHGVLLLLIVITLIFSVFTIYDQHQVNPTHLGRFANEIKSNGWRIAGLLIQRKLEMNWKLVQYSRWTTLVILVLIIFPLALFNPRGPLRRVFAHYPALRAAYIGISLSAIGEFIFNDSGIVAAATTLLIPSLAMLLLMIELE